jgi:hypothetical protein
VPKKYAKLFNSENCVYLSEFLLLPVPLLDLEIESRVAAMGLEMGALDTDELLARADQAANRHSPDCDREMDMVPVVTEYDKKLSIEYRSGLESSIEEADTDAAFRNIAWTEKLVTETAKGGVFVVVGVGHLFGNKGLLALLRQQGVDVERVSTAAL